MGDEGNTKPSGESTANSPGAVSLGAADSIIPISGYLPQVCD